MRMTKRGRRRLLVLFAIVAVLVGGVYAYKSLRAVSRARVAEQSREQGMALYEQGEYEKAMPLLSSAVARDKKDLEALLAFGDCRTRISTPNGRHLKEGVAIYRQALSLDPDNLEALEHLLELYHRVGYRVEGIEIADRILERRPEHVDAWAAKLASALFNSEFDKAIEYATRLSEIDPGNIVWRAYHVRALRAQGATYEELIEQCESWVESWDGDGRFHLFQAQLAADVGDRERARELLRQAVERGADSEQVLNSMLMTLDLLAMHEHATTLIASCRKKYPDKSWVFEAAVRRQWQISNIDQGIDLVTEAESTLEQLSVELLRWKALLYAARNEPDVVEQTVDRMLAQSEQQHAATRDSARGWAAAIRAGMQADQANWTQAIEAYEQALSLTPNDPVLKYLMARAYQQIGEHSMALSLLEEAEQADRTWVALDMARTRSLLQLGRYGEALQTAGMLLRRSASPSLRMHILLARAWLGVESFGSRLTLVSEQNEQRYNVVKMLEALHEDIGWHPELSPLLLRAYVQDEDREAAKQLLVQAAQEKPDSNVLTALADVSAAWPLGHSTKVLDLAIEQVGLREDFALTKARLLYYGSDRPEQASELLQQAIEQASDEQSVTRLRWWLARYDLDRGQPDAADKLISVIEQVDDPAMLMGLLDQSSVWEHANVVRAALDRLKQHVGDRSPRAMLAEAQYTERFEGDTEQAIATAISQVRDVLNVNPRSREALVTMADLLIKHVDPSSEEAAQKLRTAIELYPTDHTLYPKLIAILQRRGEFNSAGTYISQFGRIVGNTPAGRRAVASMYRAQGNFDDAARVLAQTPLDQMPEQDMLRLANLRQRMNEPEAAQAIYEHILESDQPSIDAISAAAKFFASSGAVRKGLSLLNERLPANQPADRALRIGRYCLDAGLLDTAEEHLQQATKINDRDVRVWSALADLRMAQGRHEAARQAIQRGLEIDPDNTGLQAVLVVVSRQLGEDTSAMLAEQVDSLKKENPALYEVLQLYEHLESPDASALESARQLIDRYPQSLPAWRVAIQMYANAGDPEQAVRLARQAASRLPTEPVPAELGARLLTETGRLNEALDMARMWRQLSAANPQPADVYIARLLVDLGRPSEALAQLRPHREEIWQQRAQRATDVRLWLHALLQAGDATQALTRIGTLLNESPESWTQPVLRLADRVTDFATFQGLMKHLSSVLSDEAGRLKRAIAWNGLAARTGNEQAIQKAQAIAASITNDPELIAAADAVRAGLAVKQNQLDKAEQLYRQVLARQSDALLAMNNLAYVLILKGDACGEAVELAGRAAEQSKNNPDVVDTLAQALACDGQLEKAAEHAQRLVGEHADNPSFRVTLAEVRLRQQQYETAATQIQRARALIEEQNIADAQLRDRLRKLEASLSEQAKAS